MDQNQNTFNQNSKNAWINLVAQVGLAVAIEVIEGINKATTDAEALAALKGARDKSLAQYVAEDKAARV